MGLLVDRQTHSGWSQLWVQWILLQTDGMGECWIWGFSLVLWTLVIRLLVGVSRVGGQEVSKVAVHTDGSSVRPDVFWEKVFFA